MPDIRNNLAFIDGQNLYKGTTSEVGGSWRVDLVKFRHYLLKKHGVRTAFYYLGFWREELQPLYVEIQAAGFIVVFRQHSEAMKGKKKGNVDTDIVFNVMKRLYQREPFDQIVLVSGDGDYKLMVDFLIDESRLRKVLAPNRRRASSLYKQIGSTHFSCLDDMGIKGKIAKTQTKEGASLGS
jgi:uncharacterized LabA/DUF88 family protein